MFSSGCRRGILSLASGGGFNPLTLFAAGEQGGWWDPSDFSTMFQDSAGTTPVTAATQPVGKILDKSGRGNHRTQGTAASRPTLQVDATGYYLLYDGVDDSLSTPAINFTGTSQISAFHGITKLSDVNGFGIVAELGNRSVAVPGSFSITAPETGGTPTFSAVAERTNTAATVYNNASVAAPVTRVLTALFDLNAGTLAGNVTMRLNGVVQGTSTGTVTAAGAFSTNAIFIGRRNDSSLPASMREYGTIVLGRTATSTEVAQVERALGAKMRIVL